MPYTIISDGTRQGRGFFSLCKSVLHELGTLDDLGMHPRISINIISSQYGNGNENIYTTYFKQPVDLEVDIGDKNITAYHHNSCGMHNDFQQSMRYARTNLAHKYFQPNDDLALKINNVCKLLGKNPLGVHYRGTDKGCETTVFSYSTYCTQIKAFVDAFNPSMVFMASDEQQVIEEVKSVIPDLTFLNHLRSAVKGSPCLMYRNLPPKRLCEEAIIDAYTLAHCKAMISGSSNLSDWAAIWSPDMPHIRLT